MISWRRNVLGLSAIGLAERATSIAVIDVVATFRRKLLQSLGEWLCQSQTDTTFIGALWLREKCPNVPGDTSSCSWECLGPIIYDVDFTRRA
jgi:hypothetical protein